MNAIASPEASRSAAPIADSGGRASSQIATAAPPTVSRTSETVCPVGPNPASILPGSGLPAGVCTAVRPSGKRTTWSRSTSARVSATGRITASAAPTPVSPARRAGPRPYSRQISSTATGRAGQAVHFRLHARASTRPVATVRSRSASAIARQQTPISGRSTPPTTSASAISGDAVSTASGSTPAPPPAGRSSRQQASRQPRKVRANQIRASPSTRVTGLELPSTVRGRPKTVMAGR